MKRIFLAALAMVTVVSCSKSDVIEQPDPVAIAFENAFVDNATRSIDPSYTVNPSSEYDLKKFKVWGFVKDASGKIFEAEEVTKDTDEWKYTNQAYWTPNNNFYFAALSDNYVSVTPDTETTDLKKGLGVVKFTTDGTKDLIYAATTRTTTNLEDPNEYAPVAFVFNHLLSKIKFTFENGFGNANTTIAVSNVTMKVPATAEIDLAVDNWWDNTDDWKNYSGDATLNLGNMVAENETNENADALKVTTTGKAVSNYECFAIPAASSQEYEVSFTATLYTGDVEVYKADLITTITGVALEMGKAYNFKATLDATNIVPEDGQLKPITFSVSSINGWGTDNDMEGGTIDTQAQVTVTQ